MLGNYPKALEYLLRALKLARDQGDVSNTAYALINLGAVYQKQGNLARNLLTGKNKAEALRRAELKLLKSRYYSHPFYWAPFVVMEDAN